MACTCEYVPPLPLGDFCTLCGECVPKKEPEVQDEVKKPVTERPEPTEWR